VKVGDLLKHKGFGDLAMIIKVPCEQTMQYLVYYISGNVAGERAYEHPQAMMNFEVISHSKPRTEKILDTKE
jgi:hypothetical protein